MFSAIRKRPVQLGSTASAPYLPLATSLCANSAPLTLIDLRTTGLVRLGVSTEAARGKAQGQGRKLSQAVYDQTDAHGLVYSSRLTGRTCICVYDRALPGRLGASPVVEVTRLAASSMPFRPST